MGELVSTLTSDLQTNLSLTPPPQLENTPPAGQVIHTHRHTAFLLLGNRSLRVWVRLCEYLDQDSPHCVCLFSNLPPEGAVSPWLSVLLPPSQFHWSVTYTHSGDSLSPTAPIIP